MKTLSDLEAAVEKAEKELEQVKIEDEVTDVICEQCGRNMGSEVWSAWKIWLVQDSRIAVTPNHIWKK